MIVVAGAGKGIGFELVKKFLAEMEDSVLAISRTTSELEKLANTDPVLKVLKADISSEEDVKRIAEFVKAEGKKIKILVNMAGVLIKKDWKELSREDYRFTFDINFYGPLLLTQKLSPFLAEEAHVVNIGSMGGVTGAMKFPGMVIYSSSKAAVGCLTECLAEEFRLEGRNIKVNALALGAVETDMKNSAFPDFEAPHTAQEMAEYIAHFALVGGKYYNGKVLPVSLSTP